MKIIYMSIVDDIIATVDEAKRNNRVIKRILLTKAEYGDLILHHSLVYRHPLEYYDKYRSEDGSSKLLGKFYGVDIYSYGGANDEPRTS